MVWWWPLERPKHVATLTYILIQYWCCVWLILLWYTIVTTHNGLDHIKIKLLSPQLILLDLGTLILFCDLKFLLLSIVKNLLRPAIRHIMYNCITSYMNNSFYVNYRGIMVLINIVSVNRIACMTSLTLLIMSYLLLLLLILLHLLLLQALNLLYSQNVLAFSTTSFLSWESLA
jgi:hypothetical protein